MSKTGRIVKIISNLLTVESEGKIYECKPRGKFYHQKLTPLVGDYVIFDDINNYILEIKQRKNYLNRPMISNVDACIIVMSVKLPDISMYMLDKMLTLIIHNKIEPVICFTKLDLLNSDELKEIDIIKKYYEKIGIKVFYNTETKLIEEYLDKKIVLLTGQTGAGKSSLLNKINPLLNLNTHEISKALNRGVHTTRHVELFKYKNTLYADTPGFSSLDLVDMNENDIKNTFIEFNVNCEYKDCKHLKEINCEVKQMVINGDILKSRYESYEKMVSENASKRIIYKK